MAKVKYLEKRVTNRGVVTWRANPSKALRHSLLIKSETFDHLEDAVLRCREMEDDYKNYLAGKHPQISKDENTVAGFIRFYKMTLTYENLARNSKVAYDSLFRQACLTKIGESRVFFGEMLLRNVDSQLSETLYKQVRDTYSQHRATHMCKVLRRLFMIALKHQKVRMNPFAKMGLKGIPARVVLWEKEQVFHFINTADKMGFSSLGTIALMCYDTCQRVSDMRLLTWGNFDGTSFRFKQKKTGVEVDLQLSPRLLERIETLTRGEPTNKIVICETTGNHYSDNRLYNKYAQRIRIEAGLPPELKLMDLRRTGATEMAEAGCTEDELRSVTGHLSRNILSTYVRPTKKLATTGLMKRFG